MILTQSSGGFQERLTNWCCVDVTGKVLILQKSLPLSDLASIHQKNVLNDDEMVIPTTRPRRWKRKSTPRYGVKAAGGLVPKLRNVRTSGVGVKRRWSW